MAKAPRWWSPRSQGLNARGALKVRRNERNRRERVIYHAQKQTDDRSNANATYPAHCDHADTDDDANDRKSSEGVKTKANTNTDGSSPRRESENNAAQLLAKTAGSPEGIIPDCR